MEKNMLKEEGLGPWPLMISSPWPTMLIYWGCKEWMTTRNIENIDKLSKQHPC